ncbi:8-amino-7-oxononanoate synthase [Clostridium luticellarii]|uniref:6-carboxyhexanoate--CoA ligase n=1 Tax=Clostridium luticellarii TaxID=1691940 RepID=A0A2T0BD35_9CLOT|nr:8-amino-7-oxononanoate synthase [Clostridium luticellarii]PRR81798.1 8-amino-7-oxononanoate synthase [Clostridium luticellarii]
MNLYSLKMRASKSQDGIEKHISGAEKITGEDSLFIYSKALLTRALYHSKGKADFINIKIEKVNQEDILFLDALPVTTVNVSSYQDGIQKLLAMLEKIGITNASAVLEKLKDTYNMRGAMLLNVDTLERLEPNKDRGIRATYMDEVNSVMKKKDTKDHYNEAIVLATKVAYAPNIIGEICISDDPDYVTGYVASKENGYMRITKLKEMGSEDGGRIFLYRGDHSKVQDCIDYIEKREVLVKNISSILNKPYKTEESTKNKWNFIDKALENLKYNNLYRTMNEIKSAQSAHVTFQGKEMIMMASNNYLDMSNDSQVKAYALKAMGKYGVGSGGSRLTTGTINLHNQLEELLAVFKGTEAALVYNTGYMANIGIISALCSKDDVIFSDELNHASIIDGCCLSKAKIVVYRHNDMNDLEDKIKQNPCSKGLVVSDAVFSMDGDIVNLPQLVEIADKYGLFSMIDEAHSTGVIGENGRGTMEYFHMTRNPDIIMGTLSKAIGSEGGFVCGKQELIEYLKNKSRSFIFSTSLSPAVMAASIKSIELIMDEPQRVQALQENIQYFCNCLREAGIEADSETAIIPIIIGDEKSAMEISRELFEQGYYISAIRYPTVKKGCARLRVALMSTHNKDELKRAARVIAAIVNRYKRMREYV